jgi:AcrR family transcriptional regulator
VTPPEAPLAPTDRGRRRREAVVDAAAELFLERGFHGTSMDDLGAAAGISGPGLYRHVASKDDLLMAVLDRLWAGLEPALDRAAGLPGDEALDVLLDAHLDLVLEQPTALVLLLRELRHLPDAYRAAAVRNHRRYVDGWVTALLAGPARADVTDADEARAIALAVHGLLDSAALTPGLMAVDRRRALLRRMARSLL